MIFKSAAPARLALFLVALFCTRASALPAAGPDSTSSATLPSPPAIGARAVEFGGKLYLGGSRTAEAGSQAATNQWSTLNASLAHTASGMSLGTLFGFTRASAEERSNFEADNPVFTVTKAWERDSGWLKKASLGISGLLPATGAAREKTFRGAAGLFADFSAAAGRWSLSENISYAQGFYDIRSSVESSDTVVPASAKASTTIDYSVTDKLTAEAMLQFLRAITYESDVSAHGMWSIALTYEINKSLAIDGGVGNMPGLLVPNPYFEQLNFDSPQARLVFMDLTLSM